MLLYNFIGAFMNKLLVLFLIGCLSLVATPAFAGWGDLGKIVILGDDILLPNDQLREEETFVPQMKARIRRDYGYHMAVKLYGQKGGTTISSVPLIPSVLAEKPDLVIVALGYNDALAKNDPDVVYNNLDNILRELERAGAYVLLVGVEAPVWMDHAYTTKFNNIFPKISQRYRIMYHNGFLKDVQGNPEMTFENRYHPTRLGISKIVDNLIPSMGPLVMHLRQMRICAKRPTAYKCDEYLLETN